MSLSQHNSICLGAGLQKVKRAPLRDAFHAFSAFGSRDSDATAYMKCSHFAKFCRDTKVRHDKIRPSETTRCLTPACAQIAGARVCSGVVDITFKRVAQGQVKIGFRPFMAAVRHLAMRRFPSCSEDGTLARESLTPVSLHV